MQLPASTMPAPQVPQLPICTVNPGGCVPTTYFGQTGSQQQPQVQGQFPNTPVSFQTGTTQFPNLGFGGLSTQVPIPQSTQHLGVSAMSTQVPIPQSTQQLGVGGMSTQVPIPQSTQQLGVGVMSTQILPNSQSTQQLGVGGMSTQVPILQSSQRLGVSAMNAQVQAQLPNPQYTTQPVYNHISNQGQVSGQIDTTPRTESKEHTSENVQTMPSTPDRPTHILTLVSSPNVSPHIGRVHTPVKATSTHVESTSNTSQVRIANNPIIVQKSEAISQMENRITSLESNIEKLVNLFTSQVSNANQQASIKSDEHQSETNKEDTTSEPSESVQKELKQDGYISEHEQQTAKREQ